jgi:hypothetical protein
MTTRPERRIRVRGAQRSDIDIDLLVQALLMIADEQRDTTSSDTNEDAADDMTLENGQ